MAELAEASLSIDQLLRVTNAVPALLAFVDRDERYVWGNEAYRDWCGVAPEKLKGMHGTEVLGSEAWETVKPYVRRALQGEVVSFETRMNYAGAPARDVHAEYVPQRDERGEVFGFVVLVHDITARRNAELALLRSERLLAWSQQMAHVGSWEMEIALEPGVPPKYQRWSSETFRIFGYEPHSIEVTDQLFFDAVHPEDLDALRAASQAAIASADSLETEHRIVRPDGSIRVLHEWAAIERDAQGRAVKMAGTCQDVTEQREAEQRLRGALEDLREAGRRKDEFLAMLSHELRNPLAPIISAIEILQGRQDDVAAETRQIYGILSRQAHHMRRLLDDLLEISRLSQGKIELRRQTTELRTILAQAVEVCQPLVIAKRHALVSDLAERPLLVDGDSARLVQVFANLLNNAAKYTDDGGTITLTARAEGSHAVVRVRDTGIGMTETMIRRAFELFEQEARSIDRAQGGLGIGLTMVRSLVMMHGGTVHASSPGLGLGSEFVVRLPLVAAELAADPAASPTRDTVLLPLRVLIVDDNADAATSLGQLLERQGHQVALANDSRVAFATATAQHFDLILLDVGLPGMDGFELARRLRDAGLTETMLVAVTGYGRDEDTRRALASGFDHHLVKPVEAEEIRVLIANRTAHA